LIYFNGCSFVKGYEMEDNKIDCFPALIAHKLNTGFYNHAKVGGGNERIQRTTQNYILMDKKPETFNKGGYLMEIEHKCKTDLVIIMWTGMNRLETMEGTRWRTANWKTFRLDVANDYLPTIDSNLTEENAKDEKYYLYLNGYVKTLSARYNLKKSISNMLATKYFLEAKNIPYLFYTFSSKHFTPLLHLLDEEYSEYTNIGWSSYEMSKKEVLRELPFLKEDGFLEITKKAKLPLGSKDHPLEEAHINMANIILGDIKKHGYDKEIL